MEDNTQSRLDSYNQQIEELGAVLPNNLLMQQHDQATVEIEILNLVIKYVGKIYIIKYLYIIYLIYRI